MKLGKNFKYYRELNGYSQEDVAQKLNISRQAISRWENDWNIPDIENLKELSRLYNVSLDELLNEYSPANETDKNNNKNSENNIDSNEKTHQKIINTQTILILSILIMGCFLNIFGIIISCFILYYLRKEENKSIAIYICCMIALCISIWNTWCFINTFFLDMELPHLKKWQI